MSRKQVPWRGGKPLPAPATGEFQGREDFTFAVRMSVRAHSQALTGECIHGARQRRFGTSQSGKAWAALMCGERECEPEWVNIADVLVAWMGGGR